MAPMEVAWRVRDYIRRVAWRRRHVAPGGAGATPPLAVTSRRQPPAALPDAARAAVPPGPRAALLRAADGLLEGQWQLLGVPRPDIAMPDWFFDAATGRRAPRDRYAFDINHRCEDETGNVKQLWELSRHHHLTVLSAAWFVSGEERYAAAVARQLQSWWSENPFLSGIHWTSGIELGIRLISWVWIRRLLDGWEGVGQLFEENEQAARQIRWHQEYLAAFRSFGSSANNHIIAEAAGQLAASCAFPWFDKSPRWRRKAAELLERELARNTFPSGVNRELATDYHRFAAELGLLAAVEANLAGQTLADATWARLCRMVDAAAAVVDERLRPPRQGDGDDGRSLVVDAPEQEPWWSFLAAGRAIFGPLPWWPTDARGDVRSTLFAAAIGRPKSVDERPERRPSHFADAGLTVLRTSHKPELWCRCDGGPHGYLSIAAHAHADALSVEVRHGAVEVLADPGTYCYHGEPQWRAYFRSTLAHNTLELAGENQSEAGGSFLWSRHATTRLLDVSVDEGGTQWWSGEHDGYRRLDPPAVHRRAVWLDGRSARLEIVDTVETAAPHRCRLAFHLGPLVEATLDGAVAALAWADCDGVGAATLRLPERLTWTAHRGETDPILGWYSPAFGRKQPAVTLLGTGWYGPDDAGLRTVLEFGKGAFSSQRRPFDEKSCQRSPGSPLWRRAILPA
ncbi:MAG: heparinase II/III family protein [Actinomycetota bacterium]|nr:heparinase II/III family protein [Actinomycetota bacterium]